MGQLRSLEPAAGRAHIACRRLRRRDQSLESTSGHADIRSKRAWDLAEHHAPLALPQWLSQYATPDCLNLLLNPVGAKRLVALSKPDHPIHLLIGPEGGLSPAEIELATQHHFQSIVLGPRILRTETAALTAIACMQSLWGDF